MTDEELDKAADLLRTSGQPEGEPIKAWAELTEAERGPWRALAQGDAGAAVD